MLAVVVVFPTPPLPEVITTTLGVSPASSGLRLYWRMELIVRDLETLKGFRVFVCVKKGEIEGVGEECGRYEMGFECVRKDVMAENEFELFLLLGLEIKGHCN